MRSEARTPQAPRTPRRLPWGSRARAVTQASPARDGAVGIVEHAGVRWINVERPTAAAINYLRVNFPFHELDLEDVVDTLERPKLDEYDDYLFLVVQFPVHSKLTRTTTAAEVDIFVGRDYVITLHDGRIKPLVRLFDEAERSPEVAETLLAQGADRLFHRILDQLIDYCFPIMRRILQKIAQIDEMIFEPNALRVVQEIATVRRDIIACRRIIKPQVAVITGLERRVRNFFGRRDSDEDLEVYFGDLADHIGKVWDILEDAKEVVEALSATAESVQSHRLNQVIKTLTIFSVILLPLNLLAGLYGMNTALPFASEVSLATFYSLLAAMAVMATVMVLVFWWRRWL